MCARANAGGTPGRPNVSGVRAKQSSKSIVSMSEKRNFSTAKNEGSGVDSNDELADAFSSAHALDGGVRGAIESAANSAVGKAEEV